MGLPNMVRDLFFFDVPGLTFQDRSFRIEPSKVLGLRLRARIVKGLSFLGGAPGTQTEMQEQSLNSNMLQHNLAIRPP